MNALFKLMLRGSAIGALSLVAMAAGCSDDDKDGGSTPGAAGDDSGGKSGGGSSNGGGTKSEAGEPGSAGDKPDGGTAGTAGTGGTGGDNGGGEPGAGGLPSDGGSPPLGNGGAPSVGTGPAEAKFCNTLSFGDADTTMILEVGTGADKVTFTAVTGHCAPPDGQACREIPTGAEVSLVLFDQDNTSSPLDEATAEILEGEDWIFYTKLVGPSSDPSPAVDGVTVDQDVAECKDIVYDDVLNIPD